METKPIVQLIAQGRYGEAAEFCERALGQVRRAGDLALEAQITHLLGVAMTRMERFEEAITMFTRAAQLSFALDNLNGVHAALHGLAEVYLIEGEYGKAWDNLRRARDTAEAIDNRAAEAMTLAQMVALAELQQDPERGIPLGEQAYKMMLELHSQPTQIHPLVFNLSRLYLLVGHPGDAVLPALTALISGLYLDKNRSDQALAHLLEVTRAVARADDWTAVGDVGRALESLLKREDQRAWSTAGSMAGEVASILARLFVDIGQLTAQSPPEQVEAVRRRSRELKPFFVKDVSLDGWVDSVLESLPAASRTAPPGMSAQDLLQEAIADYQAGRLDDALLKAGQAQGRFRQADDRYYTAITLTVTEKVHVKLGDLEQAISVCGEACKLFISLGELTPAVDCLSRLGNYNLELGEYARLATTVSQMTALALQIDQKRAIVALRRCCGIAQYMMMKKLWAELEGLGKELTAVSKKVGERGWADEGMGLVGKMAQQVGMIVGLLGVSGGNINSSYYRDALRLAAQLDASNNRQLNMVALVSSID